MAAHVLQAVLREAEAVAHCHRVQVGAKREQVCMSGPQPPVAFGCGNTIMESKRCHATLVIVFCFGVFFSLFAALSSQLMIISCFQTQVDARKTTGAVTLTPHF